jgi:hypothetical protein
MHKPRYEFQIFTVLSWPPLIIFLLFGEYDMLKYIEFLDVYSHDNVFILVPVSLSHILIILSLLPLINLSPFEEKHIEVIG